MTDKKGKLKRGYIQVYTGNGKGKSTAALGLALRAVGRGMQVIFIQFLKGEPSGEHFFVEQYKCFEIIRPNNGDCFRQSDTELRPVTGETLAIARDSLTNGKYDLVILDEIFAALGRNLLTTGQIIELMENKPDDVELVMTGREAPQEVIQRADLVTEMSAAKHYYDKGVKLRRGIEY